MKGSHILRTVRSLSYMLSVMKVGVASGCIACFWLVLSIFDCGQVLPDTWCWGLFATERGDTDRSAVALKYHSLVLLCRYALMCARCACCMFMLSQALAMFWWLQILVLVVHVPLGLSSNSVTYYRSNLSRNICIIIDFQAFQFPAFPQFCNLMPL